MIKLQPDVNPAPVTISWACSDVRQTKVDWYWSPRSYEDCANPNPNKFPGAPEKVHPSFVMTISQYEWSEVEW